MTFYSIQPRLNFSVVLVHRFIALNKQFPLKKKSQNLHFLFLILTWVIIAKLRFHYTKSNLHDKSLHLLYNFFYLMTI